MSEAPSDPFDLKRFVVAQEAVYDDAIAELRAGRKESHWMWFVFPQLKGLGHSPTAAHYGIVSLAEARAYLAHPLLGPRLRECTRVVNGIAGRSLRGIFGSPDDLKFHSSITLFSRASDGASEFAEALNKYFGGREDERTVAIIDQGSGVR